METQKIDIQLHDNSLVTLQRTRTGHLYIELASPPTMTSAAGRILRATALLGEEQEQQLREILK